MDYFSLGDSIGYSDLNALVYLLRKFKRLTSDLSLGDSSIVSDYGAFNVSGGLESVGGNFIIESPVTISSSDVLKNCFYSFVFNVIDVNLSGTVNKRTVSVTGDTGDDGVLSVTLPTDLIESDEVILPNFELDIVFDEHEYYTPLSGLHVALSVDETYIKAGETCTISGVVSNENGTPMPDITIALNLNDTVISLTTDSDGEVEYTYTGLGTVGKVNVVLGNAETVFYDGGVLAEYTGSSITLGSDYGLWLSSNGNVIVDWGDGNTSTVNNPTTKLTHTYTDSVSNHDITLIGDITSLRFTFYKCTGLTSISIPDSVITLDNGCFYECLGLTSIDIPDSVTSIGIRCFYKCTGLESVIMPDSIASIGTYCFGGCTSLVDYQLYWETPPNTWMNKDMPVNTGTMFTIPEDTTDNYVSKSYPLSKLVERGDRTPTVLSLVGSSSSIYTDGSVTFTGSLLDDEDNPVTSASVKLFNGSTLVDTLTTDSDGEFSKTVSGLSAGSYSFKATYDGDSTYKKSNSSIVNITVQNHSYALSVSASPSPAVAGSDVTISGTLTKDSNGYGSQTVTIYDSETSLGTATTSSDGTYSKTISGLTIGSHSIKAVHSNAESNVITLIVEDYPVVLTTSDVSMVYHDGTQFVATVTKNGEPYGVGESVTFSYDGTTTTREIDANGQAKTNINLNAGTYTFTTTFGTLSNTNSVVISKASSTTSLSASSTSILTTDSLTLTGEVTGTYMGSYDVKIYDGATLIDTVSVASGSYSKTLTGLTAGTHTFKAVYDGGTNWNGSESSTVTVTVTAPLVPDTITVTGTPIIQTGTVDTITATLLDGSTPVSSETLSYQIKHGSTVIDSGSDTTDSNGQISISYTGTGVGDVDVVVTYGLLQETYEVQDCILYDTTGFSKTTTTSTDTSYPSDYDFAMPSTQNFQLEFDYNNPSGFRLYFVSTNVTTIGQNQQYGIGFTRDGSGKLTFSERTTSTSNTTCQSISSGTNHYKVVFNGNVVNVWVNDVQQVSNKTLSWWDNHFPYYFNWAIWATGTGTVTNLKIKAL